MKDGNPALDAHLSLPVTGMTCAGCAGRVERALAAAQGVHGASVNLALERAEVDYAPDETAPAALADAIRGAGFGVRERTMTLALSGMTCAGCASRVERALAACRGCSRPRSTSRWNRRRCGPRPTSTPPR